MRYIQCDRCNAMIPEEDIVKKQWYTNGDYDLDACSSECLSDMIRDIDLAGEINDK